MSKKTTKTLTLLMVLILAGIVIYALYPISLRPSDKYDKNMFSNAPDNTMTRGKQKFAQKRRHNTKVTIINDNTANMGDFVFNSGGNTKIIANISLKFKNTKNGWFNGDDAEKEILKRGVILRSAIIDTMMDNHGQKVNDAEIKAKLLENINYNLSDATATELYFNKFIVQY